MMLLKEKFDGKGWGRGRQTDEGRNLWVGGEAEEQEGERGEGMVKKKNGGRK